jgi:GPH family glycoside/pentoside/hexuronide:cation symporter
MKGAVIMGKSRNKDFMASPLERRCYDTYFLGQNIIYMILTVYLAVFYAKGLGIPAITISAILFAARIWDALIDPILATIIERSHLKSGKFRPWVRVAAFTVPLLTLLCFSFSGFLVAQPMWVRVAYASITYFVWGTIYAASDAPAYSLAMLISSNSEERTLMYNYNKFTGNIGTFLVYGLFPIALDMTKNNWFLTVLVFTAVSMATMMLIYTAKERVPSERTTQPSLKDIGLAVVSNKYFLIFIVVNLIVNASNFISIMIPFVGTDIYKSSESITWIMVATFVPMLLATPLMNPLMRKFGKIQVYVMFFTCRYSLTVCLVLAAVRGLLTAPQYIIYSIFFADTVEYNFYMNGTRFEAITFAAQTFVAKVSGALCSGIGMAIIGLYGYISTTEGQVVAQPPAALDALWGVALIGPAVGSVIAAFILYKFYDLNEKKLEFIAAENAKRLAEQQ